MNKRVLPVFLVAFCLAASAAAQEATQTTAQPAPAAPAPLVVYFDIGSSTLRNEDRAVLDHASRAYNEGKPIVMILTGTADRTGDAAVNLELSQRRAAAVLRGLLARGIPADRFQVLAKGETELPVATNPGVAELQNRRVEITWR
jgi:outer membrane protein OmpA-like peptidoglycan-associated protein